ncbi:craniofacial development protein 2-like [Palaemon carinicauda]|uniref:craniofacial development protein 2-like n=1 Tax=Palaemon carinicauda TaxID=392227 RepID=UPI0035B66C10
MDGTKGLGTPSPVLYTPVRHRRRGDGGKVTAPCTLGLECLNVHRCSTIESNRCEIRSMFRIWRTDILALFETKIKGKEEVASRVSGIERGRAREGVALSLMKWITGKVVEWKEISSRLMWVWVTLCRECWALFSAYGPGCGKSEGERNEFWNELTRCVEGLGRWNYVVFMGYLNARVVTGEVEGIIGKYGVPGENESGERLVDM